MSGTDLTILVALAAGVVSFLSPCVLPLVPAYLGQLTAIAVAGCGAGRAGRRAGWPSATRSPTWPASGPCSRCSGSPRPSPPDRSYDFLAPLRVIGGVDPRGHGAQPGRHHPDPRARADLAPARCWCRPRRWRRPRARCRSAARRTGVGDRLGSRLVSHRGGWLASFGLGADLRDRLDPLHRDHPRRHPDAGAITSGSNAAGRRPAHRLHHRARPTVHRDRRRVRPRPARSSDRWSATGAPCRSSAGCSWRSSASR